MTGWADAAIARLQDAGTCPVCERAQLADRRCGHCGADLRGEEGAALWGASVAAVGALREREAARSRVPRAVPVPTAGVAVMPPVEDARGHGIPAAYAAAPAHSIPPGYAVPAAVPQRTVTAPRVAMRRTDGASLQSVLATAGAALFAVAAIVFTFFNPELADRTMRSWIIGAVTVVFLAGAWLLAGRRLQSSAEAVGGLGLVFAGLDVQAVAGSFTADDAAWTSAAIATAVTGALMLAAALRARVRVWLWTSLLALAAVPAMLGFATAGDLGGALWLAGSGFAATGLMALLPGFASRFTRSSGTAGAGYAADAGVGTLAVTSAAPTADERVATREPLRPELVALTVLQVVATAMAAGRILLSGTDALPMAAIMAVLAVQAVLATTRTIPWAWSFAGGGLAAAAGALAAGAALGGDLDALDWLVAVLPAGAALALLTCAVAPLPRAVLRVPLSLGAGLAAGAASAPSVLSALFIGSTLPRFSEVEREYAAIGPLLGPMTWPALAGLGAIAAGFGLFALCTRRRPGIRSLRPAALVVTVLYSVAAVLALSAARVLPLPAGIAVLLAATAATAIAVARSRAHARSSARVLLLIGLHLALLVSVTLAWQHPPLVPYAGVGTLIAMALVARSTPAVARVLYTGVGYAYALVLAGAALSLAGVGGIALLCLVASAGLLGAVIATFLPVGPRNWQAVLVVATVPFTIAVVQVLFERSGWTALSTGLMFALCLVLLLTRRAGLTTLIRTLAAGLLVPTLSVVIVCLGAQLLARSGSPVVLPVIATLVAGVLPSGRMIRDALIARGLPAAADAARAAIEVSVLLTGAIAVALALVREAAGFGTACLVLVLLGVGAALTSLLAGRRYGWWVAAASFTGALWSLWALNGVDVPEAYVLPPALGAVVVAVLLTLRGIPAVPLFSAGLAGAFVPVMALLIAGAGMDAVPWRAHGLLASAWVLLGVAALSPDIPGPGRAHRIGALRTPTVLAAGAAALGGTVQAVRWGSGRDVSPVLGGDAGLFLLCAGLSALAALALLIAARMLRSAAARGIPVRWLAVPGALAAGVGVWPAIAEDWFVIWGMWTLMIGWLLVMVVSARGRSRESMTPPAWVLFGMAFITAVVAWSPRELRVEMFSLPLGALLLVTGAVGMRGGADAAPRAFRPDDWPHGPRSSWWQLAPGLIVMMSASVVSTFTDPLTWRAVLVMGLALAAILLGAARRLAAPFVIGLIVLPVENVFAFAVQIGRGIDSMPWWITLATVGAVMLGIAVVGERREGTGRGVGARMRDLR